LGGRKGILPVRNNGRMVEVSTGWSGWSGAQPDGRCLPLLIFPCTRSPEVFFWNQLTRVVPEKKGRVVFVVVLQQNFDQVPVSNGYLNLILFADI